MAMLRFQTQEGSPDVLTLGNINLLYKYDFNGGQWHENAMSELAISFLESQFGGISSLEFASRKEQ